MFKTVAKHQQVMQMQMQMANAVLKGHNSAKLVWSVLAALSRALTFDGTGCSHVIVSSVLQHSAHHEHDTISLQTGCVYDNPPSGALKYSVGCKLSCDLCEPQAFLWFLFT